MDALPQSVIFKQSARKMNGSSGQDGFNSGPQQEKHEPHASSTLFIYGFWLLKTNDAQAVLYGHEIKLFKHLMKLFY
jgi:hypothetical protein